MGLADGLDEQAVVGFACDDGRAGLAAFAHGLGGVQAQTTHLGIGVAAVAVSGEDGAHLGFEEIGGVGGGGSGS